MDMNEELRPSIKAVLTCCGMVFKNTMQLYMKILLLLFVFNIVDSLVIAPRIKGTTLLVLNGLILTVAVVTFIIDRVSYVSLITFVTRACFKFPIQRYTNAVVCITTISCIYLLLLLQFRYVNYYLCDVTVWFNNMLYTVKIP